MNREITHLFGLALVLFVTLIVFTTRWTVLEREELENEPSNRRALIESHMVPRGLILARDGTRLAVSRPEGRGESRVFSREYPPRDLFAHPVGYSFIERGEIGLERSRNDALTGKLSEFGTIFRELQDEDREGDDVVTTLDAAGQRAAMAALAGRKGAIVALEPQTGYIRVMASSPSFDPNAVRRARTYQALAQDNENKPLFNRATQSAYQPGSTFKVVTAAAALDSGLLDPESIVDGSSPATISGAPLANSGGQSFGSISFTDALTNSVNTVFARLGERLGRATLLKYMERFGFNQDPPLDYPDSQMNPSAIRNSEGRIVDANDGFDVGRVAIGQGGQEGQIQVTPLQMAMVAAAVGNKGKLMRPSLTERIVQKDGRVRERIEASEQSTVMSEEAAGALAEMMAHVVEEGTGTAGALSGIRVAGKTGTAEVNNAEANQVWFIAFAPDENPRMAIAVTLEDQPIGTSGGRDAAPLAKQVLESLLGGGV